MRTIKQQHRAVSAPIADLTTYRALPTQNVEHIDPFLFLNHHGPQVYRPHNRGLPFGPHPHRGFETVTFIVAGDIMHQDSGGHQSVIEAGGIQWMTAGSGLIHSEISSDKFKEQGGPLEILQLWVNLPARHKMVAPKYIGLQKADIPEVSADHGRVTIHAVAGTWEGTPGAVQPLTDMQLATIDLRAGGQLNLSIPAARSIFFYTIRGRLRVNGQETQAHYLTEFNHDGDDLHIEALDDALLLLGHAEPFNEPIVAYGPFVMNSEDEIRQAYQDYQAGKFGTWQE
ncbi:pirin family protein [Hymenobacter busanensis]|uniref:Pirin family protein n=1 Tax=Hymenobacter busanensis TaxID=2607656 RepID=A0A7L4ZXU2_9BACT|nr:pirin family protein [Hymenobacter busanensis]KAA9332997.1 pirin family protein [Hymenobacter busanensis]QHJ08329.1 pirin family protein [Hymenobacter busanensis]